MRSRLGVAGVLAAALLGYVAADAADVVPGKLTVSAQATPTASPRPTPADPARTTARPVLPGLSAGAPRPSPDGVSAAVGPLLRSPALGPRVSALVLDAATGEPLLSAAPDRLMVPASTTKLLTAAAVLTAIDPKTTLRTRVLQGAAADEVVLVGGGDMLLSPGRPSPAVAGRAGLDELAAEVAANLTAAGQGRVAVRFDDSLFAGPNTSPAWGDADVAFGYTGRVAALGLASDRARPGRPSSDDPAATAAAAFVAALRRTGVEVAGTPARARASEGAEVLGEVASAPLSAVLGLALTESDNALSDGLARLVAQARQRPTTSASAADAVLEQVQELGVDVGSSRITDASGLGRGSLVAARVLGDVLTMAAGPDQPRLRPMLDQLPVAGFTGTLTERYTGSSTRRAAGTVRAKTGTLTGATALAGTVVNRDGRLLVLVLMADRVPATGTLAARASVDRVAAALAACGCR